MQRQLGHLNLGTMLLLFIPTVVLTPLYCYHMAVKHHEEKPFPAATVTSTACHYPQDIVFRYFMLIATSILALVFFVLFKWMANVAERIQFPNPIPKFLFYLSEFSILLYSVTVGTIDEKSTGSLHGPCAVIFFVILVIAIIWVTISLTQMHSYDTTVMTPRSLLMKQILAVYVAAVWIYCIIGLVTASEDFEGKGDKYVVIVEWNTVIFSLLWVLTFQPEWKYFVIALYEPKNSRPQLQLQPTNNCEIQEASLQIV